MLIGAVSSGHVDLADWLFLIAFIVFVIHVVLAAIGQAISPKLQLTQIGLALLALAWFVL